MEANTTLIQNIKADHSSRIKQIAHTGFSVERNTENYNKMAIYSKAELAQLERRATARREKKAWISSLPNNSYLKSVIAAKAEAKRIRDRDAKREKRAAAKVAKLCCNFCDRDTSQVSKLVESRGIHICNHCVEVCHNMLEADRLKRAV